FGIARAYADGNRDLTGGRPIGTPSYMAPEQVEGREADHRADIYALGEVCFEALTGIPPFRGETIYAVAAARLIQPPPDPCTLRHGAPAELGAAVTKAMAKDPAARFASVKDFLDALSAVSFPAEESSRNLAALAATMPMTPITLERTIASSAVSPASPHRKSVAVLPFKNSGPSEDAYLATGIAEAITDSLSMDPRLRVISLAKVTAVSAENDDPRELGEKLGVQVVCAGTIARAGDTLRVTARLVAVEDSVQMWAKRLEAKAADFFRLTDDAADAILAGLALEKQEGAAPREIPADPAIWDLYLRAKHAARIGDGARAIEILNDAMTRAPDQPALLSLYAAVQTYRFGTETDPVIADEAGALARQAAERAMAIAPNAALARRAMGELLIAHGDVESGARELAAALRIDDHLAEAAAKLGELRVRVGDTKGGMLLLKRAISLDPGLQSAKNEQIFLCELTGDTDTVDEFLDRPPPASPFELWSYWYVRARIHSWRNDVAQAERDMALTEHGPVPPATHVLRGMITRT
ncbi:MAG: protein kinase domain-containing protein, partial [Polyangiaceae bacterium]